MQKKTGASLVHEIKDLIEWLFAPIAALMVWIGKILHGHSTSLGKHETAIALLCADHESEQEKRSEQRGEMIDRLKITDGKIDDLSEKFNTLLIELAAQKR